jgi:hypothetical protein
VPSWPPILWLLKVVKFTNSNFITTRDAYSHSNLPSTNLPIIAFILTFWIKIYVTINFMIYLHCEYNINHEIDGLSKVIVFFVFAKVPLQL